MADVKVNITFNKNVTLEKLMERHRMAQIKMSERALEDSNYYCKQQEDNLMSSSKTATDYEKGILRWQQPYARMQYYLDNTRTNKNEHAKKMWAHEAASVHQSDWLLTYDRVFKGGR